MPVEAYAPAQTPDLHIPPSDATVRVAIIDTTSSIVLPSTGLLSPLIPCAPTLSLPAYAFLVTHPTKGCLLFDLGIRPDWSSALPPVLGHRIKSLGWDISAEKDLATILTEHAVPLTDIKAVVWSHPHFDHTGNPALFTASTALVVGPGFKEAFLPGYPADLTGTMPEEVWAGRELVEVEFPETGLRIGRFRACDWFGDGSFYLLSSPGHAVGHMCGLARTTADSFILMGGDAAHHAGMFRPSAYIPLPESIMLDPPVPGFPNPCSREALLRIHPEGRADRPFYRSREGFNLDDEEARSSTEGLAEFDADPRVLVFVAHDKALRDVVSFLPERVNEWKEKGWGNARWRFLGDFAAGMQEV
ncbi:Metallo-hydrolase/oxidoreductase [Trichodelitschia bisporula]|uniref:Metallo-hydrolase/oxidoreductase n=1 Tax=Trichodelitschia bisporula TaxID=703511 RepID=A0A6G1HK42_9PEZI|nr:Metallo-hydrolase/oxidoreductase [Trichodelitschia bisporula]